MLNKWAAGRPAGPPVSAGRVRQTQAMAPEAVQPVPMCPRNTNRKMNITLAKCGKSRRATATEAPAAWAAAGASRVSGAAPSIWSGGFAEPMSRRWSPPVPTARPSDKRACLPNADILFGNQRINDRAVALAVGLRSATGSIRARRWASKTRSSSWATTTTATPPVRREHRSWPGRSSTSTPGPERRSCWPIRRSLWVASTSLPTAASTPMKSTCGGRRTPIAAVASTSWQATATCGSRKDSASTPTPRRSKAQASRWARSSPFRTNSTPRTISTAASSA